MKISSAIEQISPELAKKYLENSIFKLRHHRKIIKKWAEQMSVGEWEITGEPIIFDETGSLIDGVGRLQALIQSGQNQRMFVVRGVLRKSTTVLNTGTRRKGHVIFVDRGRPNHVLILRGIKLYLSYQGKRPSTQLVISVMHANEGKLQELANFARKEAMLYCSCSDSIIFAHTLQHGIEATCKQLRKTVNEEDFKKLKGLNKLLALEKL